MLYIIFHILIMGSSFLALNVQFGGYFQILWKIFQGKGKNLKKSAIGTFNDRLC